MKRNSPTAKKPSSCQVRSEIGQCHGQPSLEQHIAPPGHLLGSAAEIPNLAIQPAARRKHPVRKLREFFFSGVQCGSYADQVVGDTVRSGVFRGNLIQAFKCTLDETLAQNLFGGVSRYVAVMKDAGSVHDWLDQGAHMIQQARTVSGLHSGRSTRLVESDGDGAAGGKSGQRRPVKKLGEPRPPVPPRHQPLPNFHTDPSDVRRTVAIGAPA